MPTYTNYAKEKPTHRFKFQVKRKQEKTKLPMEPNMAIKIYFTKENLLTEINILHQAFCKRKHYIWLYFKNYAKENPTLKTLNIAHQQVDLHGMHKEEALAKLRFHCKHVAALAAGYAEGLRLDVVTGAPDTCQLLALCVACTDVVGVYSRVGQEQRAIGAQAASCSAQLLLSFSPR